MVRRNLFRKCSVRSSAVTEPVSLWSSKVIYQKWAQYLNMSDKRHAICLELNSCFLFSKSTCLYLSKGRPELLFALVKLGTIFPYIAFIPAVNSVFWMILIHFASCHFQCYWYMSYAPPSAPAWMTAIAPNWPLCFLSPSLLSSLCYLDPHTPFIRPRVSTLQSFLF